RYTRDTVLNATLEVIRREGLRAVSARSVAKALDASTAPVSAAFDSMQALIEAAVDRIIALLLATLEAARGPDPLRAAAFGFARFTADEPNYYEALFLLPHAVPPDWVRLRRSFSERLDRHERFGDLSPRQRDALAWRASVVTHGICIEIWSGRWARTDDEALRRLVDQLVEPITAMYLFDAGVP
ncbi:MAG: TetR/AcrR family transcriptional regulator, partial [Myxococcota bacterium]